MINKNLQKKGLVLLTIALFFGMCVASSTGYSELEKYASTKDNASNLYKPLNGDPTPIPNIFGMMGENNWYISHVMIGFSYDPKFVESIHYSIDDGNWQEYTVLFEISEDGTHVVNWYWVDKDGREWSGTGIELQIDQTPPTITLTKQTFPLDKNKLKFKADVSDPASGVERVEFYLDGELQETLTSPPYDWEYVKADGDEEEHFVYAIVYDYAGHSEESETLSTPLCSFYDAVILSKFLQRMQSMNMWNQNVLNLIFHLFSLFRSH